MQEQMLMAAEYIRQGRLVAFPTETVYGLGANAFDPAAVKRIFRVKGRPADNPLIVHIADYDMLPLVARHISAAARHLMETFWPGPLSLVLPKTERVPDIVTAGLDTVAVRWPNHPLAARLILLAGLPVAAPSANLSGKPSPTLAAHVRRDLGGSVDLILDAGAAAVGLESTVLDMSGSQPVLLRPGAVTREDLEAVLGPVQVASGIALTGQAAPSPGMKYTHYAPEAPLYLYLGQPSAVVAAHKERLQSLLAEGKRVGILTYDEYLEEYERGEPLSLGSFGQPLQAAQNLYQLLRKFDELAVDEILAHGYPSAAGLGLAIQNRLLKAAGFRLQWV